MSVLDSLASFDTTGGQVARDSLANPPLTGEMPEDTARRQQNDAIAIQREQLKAEQAAQRQNRMSALDFASRSVPTFRDPTGAVQPVKDESGAPLTNLDKRHSIAWDSLGKPQKITYGAEGAPVLSDPFADVPVTTDKTGNQYKVTPGLPWQWQGTDADITAANEKKARDRAVAKAAAAVGGKLSLDQRAAVTADHDFKSAQKQFGGIASRSGITPDTETGAAIFGGIDAGDSVSAQAAIDAHFNTLYAAPEANEKAGMFSNDLSPAAKALRAQIDADKAQAHTALNRMLDSRARHDGAQARMLATRATAEKLAAERANAALAEAGMPPIAETAIPGATTQQPAAADAGAPETMAGAQEGLNPSPAPITAPAAPVAAPDRSFGSAFKQGIDAPLEAIGTTAQVLGAPGVGGFIKGITDAPVNYESASERFTNPQAGDFTIGGFAPAQIPRAIVEQFGQLAGSLISRVAGGIVGGAIGGASGAPAAGVGAAPGAVTGAVLGQFAGPFLFGALQIAGPTALERAKRNGRTDPTGEDIAAALVTAAGSGALDSLGAQYLPGGKKLVGSMVKRIASAFYGEGVTEGLQSIVEQTGETAGTIPGLDVSVKQAIGEGVIGGLTGATATGAHEGIKAATQPPAPPSQPPGATAPQPPATPPAPPTEPVTPPSEPVAPTPTPAPPAPEEGAGQAAAAEPAPKSPKEGGARPDAVPFIEEELAKRGWTKEAIEQMSPDERLREAGNRPTVETDRPSRVDLPTDELDTLTQWADDVDAEYLGRTPNGKDAFQDRHTQERFDLPGGNVTPVLLSGAQRERALARPDAAAPAEPEAESAIPGMTSMGAAFERAGVKSESNIAAARHKKIATIAKAVGVRYTGTKPDGKEGFVDDNGDHFAIKPADATNPAQIRNAAKAKRNQRQSVQPETSEAAPAPEPARPPTSAPVAGSAEPLTEPTRTEPSPVATPAAAVPESAQSTGKPVEQPAAQAPAPGARIGDNIDDIKRAGGVRQAVGLSNTSGRATVFLKTGQKVTVDLATRKIVEVESTPASQSPRTTPTPPAASPQTAGKVEGQSRESIAQDSMRRRQEALDAGMSPRDADAIGAFTEIAQMLRDIQNRTPGQVKSDWMKQLDSDVEKFSGYSPQMAPTSSIFAREQFVRFEKQKDGSFKVVADDATWTPPDEKPNPQFKKGTVIKTFKSADALFEHIRKEAEKRNPTPAPSPAPSSAAPGIAEGQRVRGTGKTSMHVFKVLEKLPQTDAEKANDEQFYRVQREKSDGSGEITVVGKDDIQPIKTGKEKPAAIPGLEQARKPSSTAAQTPPTPKSGEAATAPSVEIPEKVEAEQFPLMEVPKTPKGREVLRAQLLRMIDKEAKSVELDAEEQAQAMQGERFAGDKRLHSLVTRLNALEKGMVPEVKKTAEQQRIEAGTKRIGDTYVAPAPTPAKEKRSDKYLATLNPMQKGKAAKVLEVQLRTEGRAIKTRAEIIEDAVGNGATMGEQTFTRQLTPMKRQTLKAESEKLFRELVNSGAHKDPNSPVKKRADEVKKMLASDTERVTERSLNMPDGSFRTAKEITSTGLDYAEHLIESKEKPIADPFAGKREEPVFSDTYTGPRWTYGLRNRPMQIGAQPKGYIIQSDGPPTERFRHGTIQYPRELTADELRSYEMELVSDEKPLTTSDKVAEQGREPSFDRNALEEDINDWIKSARDTKNPPKTAEEAWSKYSAFDRSRKMPTEGEAYFKDAWNAFASAHAPPEVTASAPVTRAAEKFASKPDSSAPKMKAQKAYLLDALDKAIADAPEEINDKQAARGEAWNDREQLRATEDRIDKELVTEGLNRYTPKHTEEKQKRLSAEHADLLAKYKVPTGTPAFIAPKSLAGEGVVPDVAAKEFSYRDRLDLLDSALRTAITREQAVTIEVPGDGTFSIVNTKDALKAFRKTAQKFPTRTLGPEEPSSPASNPTALPALKTPKGPGDAVRAVSLAISEDTDRLVLNYVFSNGTHLVATDGRRLVMIEQKAGGTEKAPVFFTGDAKVHTPPKTYKDEKGKDQPYEFNYPNFRQVIPDPKEMSPVGKAKTDTLFRRLAQAKRILTEKDLNVRLWSQDGEIHVTAISNEEDKKWFGGEYSSGVDEAKAKFLGFYNAEYVLDAVRIARALGHETVTFNTKTSAELAGQDPLTITAKGMVQVMMPMRVESNLGTGTGKPTPFGEHATALAGQFGLNEKGDKKYSPEKELTRGVAYVHGRKPEVVPAKDEMLRPRMDALEVAQRADWITNQQRGEFENRINAATNENELGKIRTEIGKLKPVFDRTGPPRSITYNDIMLVKQLSLGERQRLAMPVENALRSLSSASGSDPAGIAIRGTSAYADVLRDKFTPEQLAAARVTLSDNGASQQVIDEIEGTFGRWEEAKKAEELPEMVLKFENGTKVIAEKEGMPSLKGVIAAPGPAKRGEMPTYFVKTDMGEVVYREDQLVEPPSVKAFKVLEKLEAAWKKAISERTEADNRVEKLEDKRRKQKFSTALEGQITSARAEAKDMLAAQDRAQIKLETYRRDHDVENTDYNDYIRQGKELPPSRAELYEDAPKPSKAESVESSEPATGLPGEEIQSISAKEAEAMARKAGVQMPYRGYSVQIDPLRRIGLSPNGDAFLFTRAEEESELSKAERRYQTLKYSNIPADLKRGEERNRQVSAAKAEVDRLRAGKNPWELTYDQLGSLPSTTTGQKDRIGMSRIAHADAIEQAMREGKTIPEAVRNEYPKVIERVEAELKRATKYEASFEGRYFADAQADAWESITPHLDPAISQSIPDEGVGFMDFDREQPVWKLADGDYYTVTTKETARGNYTARVEKVDPWKIVLDDQARTQVDPELIARKEASRKEARAAENITAPLYREDEGALLPVERQKRDTHAKKIAAFEQAIANMESKLAAYENEMENGPAKGNQPTPDLDKKITATESGIERANTRLGVMKGEFLREIRAGKEKPLMLGAGVPERVETKEDRMARFRADSERRRAERDAFVANAVSAAGESGGLIYRSTVAGREDAQLLVTPDISGDGAWRVTQVDQHGPYGHFVFQNREAAIRAVAGESHSKLVPGPPYFGLGPYKLEHITKTREGILSAGAPYETQENNPADSRLAGAWQEGEVQPGSGRVVEKRDNRRARSAKTHTEASVRAHPRPQLARLQESGVVVRFGPDGPAGIEIDTSTWTVTIDAPTQARFANMIEEAGLDGDVYLSATNHEEAWHAISGIKSGYRWEQERDAIAAAMTADQMEAIKGAYPFTKNRQILAEEYVVRLAMRRSGQMLPERASNSFPKAVARLEAELDRPQGAAIEAHVEEMNTFVFKTDMSAQRRALEAEANRRGLTPSQWAVQDAGGFRKFASDWRAANPIGAGEPSQRITPEQDARYLELAKEPEKNREELQRMVDAAAKAAGYDVGPVWRGELSGERPTEYDRRKRREYGIFTAETHAGAAGYDSENAPRAFYIGGKKLDLTGGEWMDNAEAARFIRKWSEESDYEWNDPQSGEEVNPEDVAFSGRLFDYEGNWSAKRWNDLQAYVHSKGYNAVRLDDTIDGERQPVWVALDANAIKSADPITRDASGAVIPLSQRFNPESPSILYAGEPQSPGARLADEADELDIPLSTETLKALIRGDVAALARVRARIEAKRAEKPESLGAGVPQGPLPPGSAVPLPPQPTPPNTPPGRIDSVFRRILSGGRWFWEGTADVLERAGYKELATAIKHQFEAEAREFGEMWKPIRDVLEKHTKPEIATAKKEFGDYFQHRENGRDAYAATQLPTYSLAGRELIAAWKHVAVETGARLTNLGVEVQNKGGSWRPIGNLGERFFPRKINQATMKVLQEPERYPSRWQSLVNDLIANGNITTEAEADAFLREHVWHETSKNDYFATIERARTGKLPESWLEYKFDEIAPWYATHYARRVGQIEAYGQEHKGGDLFDKTLATMPKRKPWNTTQEYVEAAKDAAYMRRDHTGLAQGLRNLQTIATGTFLTNPFSAIRNVVSGVTQTAVLYGPVDTLKATWKTIHSMKDGLNHAHELGVMRDDMMQMMVETRMIDETTGAQILRKTANLGLTASGFNLAEQFARTVALTAAADFARSYRTASGAKKDQMTAFLIRNDANPALILAGDKNATNAFIRNSVAQGQGSYKFSQTPLYMAEPKVAFLMQFGKWGTQMTRTLVKHAINPAVFGTQVGGKNVRTFVPLLSAVAFAIGGGELLYLIRDLFTDRDRPDASLEEINKALTQNQREGIQQIANRAFSDVIMGGTLGMLSDYAGNMREFATRNRFKNPFDPPGVQAFKNVFTILATLKQQRTLTAKDIKDAFETQFSGAKFIEQTARNVAGDKWQEALQTQTEARQAGMRMAKELGLTVQAPFSASMPVKTPKTPYYTAINDALLTGDVAGARKAARELVASLPPRERAKASSSIATSVSQHQPIKVGGIAGARQREEFSAWARRRLPSEQMSRITRLDATYWRTAMQAGLVSRIPQADKPQATTLPAPRLTGSVLSRM